MRDAQLIREVRPGAVIQASATSGQPSGPGALQSGWFIPRSTAATAGFLPTARSAATSSALRGPAARSDATTRSKGWRTLAPGSVQLSGCSSSAA